MRPHAMPVPPVLAHRITEAGFMDQVTQLAELRGWQWAHFRPARTERGWRTPVSGPLGKGWPDLVLARQKDKRILFVELKRDNTEPNEDQQAVLDALWAAGADVLVWRPEDWKVIEATLR